MPVFDQKSISTIDWETNSTRNQRWYNGKFQEMHSIIRYFVLLKFVKWFVLLNLQKNRCLASKWLDLRIYSLPLHLHRYDRLSTAQFQENSLHWTERVFNFQYALADTYLHTLLWLQWVGICSPVWTLISIYTRRFIPLHQFSTRSFPVYSASVSPMRFR